MENKLNTGGRKIWLTFGKDRHYTRRGGAILGLLGILLGLGGITTAVVLYALSVPQKVTNNANEFYITREGDNLFDATTTNPVVQDFSRLSKENLDAEYVNEEDYIGANQQLTTNINGVMTDLNALTARVLVNEGNIRVNAMGISTNAGVISTNTMGISTNAGVISTNTMGISTNAGVISTNTMGISTNAGVISTNTMGISTNAGVISTNTMGISTNAGVISTNTMGISTNAGVISTNTMGISTNLQNINTLSTNVSTLSTRVDAEFIKKTGELLITGLLSYSVEPGTPTAMPVIPAYTDLSLVTKGYVDSEIVKLNTGSFLKIDGTLDATGLLSYATDLTPTSDNELVNKKYVDDQQEVNNYSFSINPIQPSPLLNQNGITTPASPTFVDYVGTSVTTSTSQIIYTIPSTVSTKINRVELVVDTLNFALDTVQVVPPTAPAPIESQTTVIFIRQPDGTFQTETNTPGTFNSEWTFISNSNRRAAPTTVGGASTFNSFISRWSNRVSINNNQIVVNRSRLSADVPVFSGSVSSTSASVNTWVSESRAGGIKAAADSISLIEGAITTTTNVVVNSPPTPIYNEITNLPAELVATNFPVINSDGQISLPLGYRTSIKVNTSFIPPAPTSTNSIFEIQLIGVRANRTENILFSKNILLQPLTQETLTESIYGDFLRNDSGNTTNYLSVKIRYRTYGGGITLQGTDVRILYKKV